MVGGGRSGVPSQIWDHTPAHAKCLVSVPLAVPPFLAVANMSMHDGAEEYNELGGIEEEAADGEWRSHAMLMLVSQFPMRISVMRSLLVQRALIHGIYVEKWGDIG